MIYIHYWLLFLKKNNFKFTAASQWWTFDSLSLFQMFLSHLCFLNISSQMLMHKETSCVQSISHIVYFESFCYVRCYIVLGLCIGESFLEECFYCYSQQIKSVVGNESLVPYKLIKKAPCFFWVENCYLLTWNLVHIFSNLKTFKEAIFSMWREILYWSQHISPFSAGNLTFTSSY